jgi:hypothetical protein
MVAMKRLMGCILLWLGLIAAAYVRRETVPTVEGPEATGLINQTRGFILKHAPKGGIKVISLPELLEKMFETKVRLDSKSAIVKNLSGPDEDGRIVYTAEGLGNPLEAFLGPFGKGRHYLVWTTLPWKKHEVIFSRPKSLRDAVGLVNPLSLAPKGGHVAFIRKDGEIPNESFTLEIWDFVKKHRVAEFQVSQFGGMFWFSDGKRIAYGKDLDHREIPEFDSLPLNWSQSYRSEKNRPRIKVIFIYDLSNNSHTFFHTGYHPVVASDDKSLLLYDANYILHLMEFETKMSKHIDWRVIRSPIAFAAPDIILSTGLPTAGTPAQWTKVYSPFVHTRPMLSIKLVNLLTGEFQTVIDSFEPRVYLLEGQISFGRVTESLPQQVGVNTHE